MLNVIITGGGTGGHIFPAIAIANAIKSKAPESQILFVGATGGMELTLVPKAGYAIESVWISGFYRQLTLKNFFRNLILPLKLIVSHFQAQSILKKFKPNWVIGVGGFASYPVLKAALSKKGIKTAIAEQNVYPGLVNRKLAPLVDIVFLGSPESQKHLNAKKIIVTGNPIRGEILNGNPAKILRDLGLTSDKPILLVLGGSLGSQKINEVIYNNIDKFTDVQLIWQCGNLYHEKYKFINHPNVRVLPFIEEMGGAYACADLVLSRSGALTVEELKRTGVPAVLVPSPNVADNHQFYNAKAIEATGQAIILEESNLASEFESVVLALINDTNKLNLMRNKYPKPDISAEEIIANIVIA